jgi:hypothetical protein
MSDEEFRVKWTGVSSKVAVLPSAVGEMVAASLVAEAFWYAID